MNERMEILWGDLKSYHRPEWQNLFFCNLSSSLQVLSIIKWRGPKSNELSSKFWKQVVYDMPAKRRETLSRRQVHCVFFHVFSIYFIFLQWYSLHSGTDLWPLKINVIIKKQVYNTCATISDKNILDSIWICSCIIIETLKLDLYLY